MKMANPFQRHKMAAFLLPFALILSLFCFSGCRETGQRPLSSELQKALAAFEIAEGFRIELIAAEPLIADPVAMEVDENGVFYVVEMHGYPLDVSGSGLVKILKDTDTDGLPDTSVVFADSLVLPTGIMKWRKGVLVTDPPHVWYLEDSNGDDRADIRKKILTGFALSNPQHNLNTPVFGLDNWIYLAHQWAVTPIVCTETFSDEGTEVYFPDNPGAPRLPRNADDRNVRFRPDSYEIEALSGNSQFGQTFDPWGHQIMNENAHHLYHEVIADRYLRRNPNVLIPDVVQNLPDHGNACEVYPITENPQHQLLTDVGVITSACGVTWYQGGAFPEPYNHHCTFVAEPVHNLVHVDRIKDQGATFSASRILENREFLASRDPFFRPCNFYTGPDGALYVLDYYRPIIEHPEWMSDEVNNSGRLYEGSDKGRIYRIVPEKGLPMDWMNTARLGQASDAGLIKYLDHPNIWYRRNAQRLLFQRNSTSVGLIRKAALTAKTPEGRVHALWLLEGLGKMDEPVLTENLAHPHPGVRENTVRIAELHLGQFPGLEPVLTAMSTDQHPKVRYQLLCTLGFLEDEKADQVRISILQQDLEDPWVQVAALTGVPGREMALLDLAQEKFKGQNSGSASRFFSLLAAAIGNSNDQQAIQTLIQKGTRTGSAEDAGWQSAVLEGLYQLWQYKGAPAWIGETEKSRLLQHFDQTPENPLRSACLNLLTVTGLPGPAAAGPSLQDAAKWAKERNLPEAVRVDAMQLLALSNPVSNRVLFEQRISPVEPESVQKAAMNALGKIPGDGVTNFLLDQWSTLTPDLKDHAVNLFLSAPGRMHRLLDAVAAGKVKASFISWPRQVRLMNNDDTEVREHARKVLTAPENSDRQKVVNQYQAALQGAGDAAKGKLVFDKACRQCHRMQGEGVNFGPDLASIRNREPRFILADILNPNRSIADAYEMWTLELKSRTVETGVIISETSASITIKNLAGIERTFSRAEILSLQSSPVSAMPDGLENTIGLEEMRNLLAYLKKGDTVKDL